MGLAEGPKEGRTKEELALDSPTLDALWPFAAADAEDFYATMAWYRVLAETTVAPSETAELLVAGRAALAVVRPSATGAGPVRLRGFANCYSCRFGPLGPDGRDVAALAEILAQARWDAIDLPGMDRDAPGFAALQDALRKHGFFTQAYFHFGNWYEVTQGMDSKAYLATRPGSLRSTIKRHENRLKRQDCRITINGDAEHLAAYEQVYAKSWKQAEPFPRFMPALIRACAATGALRLGVLWLQDVPVAAQVWIVWNNRATIFKLAHDEAFKAESPGTVLTMATMRHVLDRDRVEEVDFGRGDDDYKKLWLPRRRERWGLAAFNSRTFWGSALAARHLGPALIKRLLRR